MRHLASSGSTGRMRASRRRPWTRRRGEGGPVAMATATASSRPSRPWWRGREGGEGENGGAVRAIETALAGLFAAPRKLAGRRWHGRVCAHGEHALGVLLARWRRRLASASWFGPCWARPGKRQVSLLSLSLSFISVSVFLFCYFVLGFIKNARAFPKIMKLIMATV